jgi:hypothetical protein
MTTHAERYDDRGDAPLKGYALLATAFAAGTGAFAVVARRRGSGRPARCPRGTSPCWARRPTRRPGC